MLQSPNLQNRVAFDLASFVCVTQTDYSNQLKYLLLSASEHVN